MVLTTMLLAIHTCRRVDPRHVKNLLGRLRVEDPQGFQNLMKTFSKKTMGRAEYEAAKAEFLKK